MDFLACPYQFLLYSYNTTIYPHTFKCFMKLCIIDESDFVTVIAFDQVARLLIGRSADDVFDSWLQVGRCLIIFERSIYTYEVKMNLNFRIHNVST